MKPDKDNSPVRLAAPKGKGGLFAGMNVLKKAAPKPPADTPPPPVEPVVHVPETEPPREPEPPAPQIKEETVKEEAVVPPPEKKKVPFFKNFKSKKQETEAPTPATPVREEPNLFEKSDREPSILATPKKQAPPPSSDGSFSGIKEPSKEGKEDSFTIFRQRGRSGQGAAVPNDSADPLPESTGATPKEPSGKNNSIEHGEGEVNLIDNLDFTIPSSVKSQIDDDFMNLNFHRPDPSEADKGHSQVEWDAENQSGSILADHRIENGESGAPATDIARTAEARPKKTAFGFIKKSTDPKVLQVFPENAPESQKKDDSSILEKINQNLNEISDNSRDDFNSSEIAVEKVPFSDKIRSEFKVSNLKPRIDDRFSNFVSTVALVLAKGNEAMRNEALKEQREKQAAARLADLEKKMEEALAVEDYDAAEALQGEIDALNVALAKEKESAGREEGHGASLKDFEKEKDKIGEELKKLSGIKIFIKEKMMYFEESESSNYDRNKRSLEATKSDLTASLASKSKALESAENHLTEKTGELKAKIQASEEVLASQNQARDKVTQEIEELKKKLVQKENELFSLNKEIGATEEKINQVKVTFEPILGKLRLHRNAEEEAVAKLRQTLVTTEKSLADNEAGAKSMAEELKAVTQILDQIEELKTTKSAALALISQNLTQHFQNVASFGAESKKFFQIRDKIESSLTDFKKVQEEIKAIGVKMETQKSEIQKIQAKSHSLDSAKKEAVKNKNFAQAKHFSTELKDLETLEAQKKEELVVLLSELDSNQKKLPELDKKHQAASQTLNQARAVYLEGSLKLAKERLQIAESLAAVEELENEELTGRKEEFSKAVSEIEEEFQGLRGKLPADAPSPLPQTTLPEAQENPEPEPSAPLPPAESELPGPEEAQPQPTEDSPINQETD